MRDEIYRTLERFQADPADAEKLAQLKRRHKYGFLMDLDTPDGVAGALARPIALTGGIECVDRLYAALDRATPDDIMRAARKYFVPARRTVMVLKGTGRMNIRDDRQSAMAVSMTLDRRPSPRIQRRAAARGQRPDDQFPALVPRRLAKRSARQGRPGGADRRDADRGVDASRIRTSEFWSGCTRWPPATARPPASR